MALQPGLRSREVRRLPRLIRRTAVTLFIAGAVLNAPGAASAASLPLPDSGAEAVEPSAPCQDLGPNNRWLGNGVDLSGWSARGVVVTIDPATSTMVPCTSNFGNDGVIAWPAIVPGADNTYGSNFTTIMQIRIARCNFAEPNAPCYTPTPHFFFADGGCFNYPTLEDLGPANWSAHTYHIYKNSAGDWVFKIDGVTKKIFDGSTTGSVSCWQASDKAASYMVETFDGGDFIGGDASRLQFYDAGYQSTVGGTWVSTTWFDPCDQSENSTEYDHKCNVYNSTVNRFEVWSVPW